MTANIPIENAVTYRLVMYRPIALAVYVALGFAGMAMFLNLLAGGIGPPPAFVFLWLAALAGNAYWGIVRIAYEVGVVHGSILRWRSITTTHEVPLFRVTAIKTWMPPFGAGVRKIVVDGDRSPLLLFSTGYDDVVAMLLEFRPDLVIQTTWFDRFIERFSKRSMTWQKLRMPP